MGIPRQIKRRPIPNKLREEIFLRDKICLRCGSKKGLQIDHIIPVMVVIPFPKTEGMDEDWKFLNHRDNLQVLCGLCNRFSIGVDYRNFTSKDRRQMRVYMIMKIPGLENSDQWEKHWIITAIRERKEKYGW